MVPHDQAPHQDHQDVWGHEFCHGIALQICVGLPETKEKAQESLRSEHDECYNFLYYEYEGHLFSLKRLGKRVSSLSQIYDPVVIMLRVE